MLTFSTLSAIVHPQTLDGDVAHLIEVFVGLLYGYYLKNKENKSLND